MNPVGNPNLKPGPGRPKGSSPKCVKVRNDFIEAYFKMGGIKWLIGFLSDKRNARDFLFRVLPLLMPKKLDIVGTLEVQHGLKPEMEALMKALIEARRTVDPTPDQRETPQLEYRA